MWVPLMVFAFLFGLSMDYEVFILTGSGSAYDTTGDARAAVTEGLGRTGRLVTSAGAILMLAFLSMSTGPQTDLKDPGHRAGSGILIDAVVIRCLWSRDGRAVRPRQLVDAVRARQALRVPTRPRVPAAAEPPADRGRTQPDRFPVAVRLIALAGPHLGPGESFRAGEFRR